MGSSKVLWRRFAQGEKMQVHSTRVLNGFSAQTARADLRLVQDETLVFVVGCGEPRRASRLLHDQTRRMTRRMPSSSTATGTQKWLSVRMARSISVLGTGEHSIGFGRATQDRPEGRGFYRRAASWRLMRGRDRRLVPGLKPHLPGLQIPRPEGRGFYRSPCRAGIDGMRLWKECATKGSGEEQLSLKGYSNGGQFPRPEGRGFCRPDRRAGRVRKVR
jgi:hypothetical protein